MFRVEIERGWGSKLLVSCRIVNSPPVLISSLMPLIVKIFSVDSRIEHSKQFEFEQVALLWGLYLLLVKTMLQRKKVRRYLHFLCYCNMVRNEFLSSITYTSMW